MTFLPIVDRELRIAARRPATYWLRTVAGLCAITVVLLALMNLSTHLPGPVVAKRTFRTLGALMMVLCLFAGMFQTADCLSSEKREGTLGLLFLTDLRGYDVVLGKLAANSLHSFYALLSVLPIMAIPLMAGGVTAGEFWRVVVVLLTGLFFSMGVGIFVSAFTRETRQSLLFSALLIVFIAGLLPALYQILWLTSGMHAVVPLLSPSLGYALTMSFDEYYSYRTGAGEFWGSIATIAGIGLVGLIIATVVLPRTWHESTRSGDVRKGGSVWRRLRFGTVARRLAIRPLLAVNPFHWLATQDRLSQLSFWLMAGVLVPFWLLFACMFFKKSGPGFGWIICLWSLIFINFGLAVIFKFLVASEASRRFNDDRRSGALELLLVTPLSEKKMINGQLVALTNQFLVPIVLIEALFFGLWMLYGSSKLRDNGEFVTVMIGNMVCLATDFMALKWVGMWTGLRCRYHHRAVALTLLQILVLPWLLFFLLGVLGFFGARTGVTLFLTWYCLCIVNDLLWASLARQGLRREFRELAAGGIASRRNPWAIAKVEYSDT